MVHTKNNIKNTSNLKECVNHISLRIYRIFSFVAEDHSGDFQFYIRYMNRKLTEPLNDKLKLRIFLNTVKYLSPNIIFH